MGKFMSMLWIALSSVWGGGSEMALVQDGAPKAVIVTPDKPTQSAQLAAIELRDHVRMITGAELPIVSESGAIPGGIRVYVGDTKFANDNKLPQSGFKREEYAMRFLPDSIILAGRDEAVFDKVVRNPEAPKEDVLPSIWNENGTLNAVYDFLENQCGVRWFNPTEFGVIVPKKKTLSVKASDLRRSPFFLYRQANYVDYDQHMTLWEPNTKEFSEWEAAAFPELKKKYPDQQRFLNAKRKLDHLYLLRMRSGGEYSHCNHSYYGYYDRFWKQNPARPQAFEGARPEYFAQGYGDQKPQQMCYSSPELVRQSGKDAAEYFKRNSKPGSAEPPVGCWGKNFFAVVPQDNFAYCKCPGCVKKMQDRYSDGETDYNRSPDLVFGFVNEVAREIKKNNPDKFVSCLAYLSYMDLPSFKLEDNVVVHVCMYNSRFPTFLQKEQFDLLKKWGEKESRPLYLWLYGCFPKLRGKNGKYHCFPGFNAHCYGEQYKTFKKIGVKGMFYDGFGEEVDAYISLKLMDNPDLDADALFEEYFGQMYGPAAKPLRQMYIEIEKIYNDKDNYPNGYKGTRPQQTEAVAWGRLGTAPRMKMLGELMDEAKKLAVDEPYASRVRLWEKGIWSFMVEGRAIYERKANAVAVRKTVAKVPDAGGDASKVDWSSIPSTGQFSDSSSDKPAPRMLAACLAHDGKFLYMRLSDPCDTAKLKSNPGVFLYDDWEVFVSKTRGDPSRQYAFNASGEIVSLAHGEDDGAAMKTIPNPGLKVVNQVAPGKWTAFLAMPLDSMLSEKVAAGGKIYMNVVRVSSPGLTPGTTDLVVSCMTSFFTIREMTGLAEMTLAE